MAHMSPGPQRSLGMVPHVVPGYPVEGGQVGPRTHRVDGGLLGPQHQLVEGPLPLE